MTDRQDLRSQEGVGKIFLGHPECVSRRTRGHQTKVLQNLPFLGKGPEKQPKEDGSVCEIGVEVGWGRTLCRKEDSLCSRMEWKMETVRSGCVRGAWQAKQFELCPMAAREAWGGFGTRNDVLQRQSQL